MFRIAPNIIWRSVNDDVLILDTNTGNFFSLDSIGARIWLQVVEGRSPVEIAQELAREHTVSEEQVFADVCDILERLNSCFEEPIADQLKKSGDQILPASTNSATLSEEIKNKTTYKKPTLRDCGQIDHVAAYSADS